MDRYTGKPFLRLLECYVLDSIGQLGDKQRVALADMEPKLRETYRAQGSWKEIVSQQMEFQEALPGKNRLIWEDCLKKAYGMGESVDPNEFARSFVDTNFVN